MRSSSCCQKRHSSLAPTGRPFESPRAPAGNRHFKRNNLIVLSGFRLSLSPFAFPRWQLRLDRVPSLCFQRVTSVFNSCELRLKRQVAGFGLWVAGLKKGLFFCRLETEISLRALGLAPFLIGRSAIRIRVAGFRWQVAGVAHGLRRFLIWRLSINRRLVPDWEELTTLLFPAFDADGTNCVIQNTDMSLPQNTFICKDFFQNSSRDGPAASVGGAQKLCPKCVVLAAFGAVNCTIGRDMARLAP